MLTAVGFTFNQALGSWLHVENGRAITKETVAAHDTDWLAHWITGRRTASRPDGGRSPRN